MSIVPIIVIFIVSLLVGFVARVAQRYGIVIFVFIITTLTAGIIFYYSYSVILGGLYRKKGDYEKAAKHYLRAKTIGEKTLGKEHPDYAALLDNMGRLSNNMDMKALNAHYAPTKAYDQLRAAIVGQKAFDKELPDNATLWKSLENNATLWKSLERPNLIMEKDEQSRANKKEAN